MPPATPEARPLATTADGQPIGFETFEELVRDALAHLHDQAHLQTHALASLQPEIAASGGGRGRFLWRSLLDAIESLRPRPGAAAGSAAWRAYKILDLRYVEGREIADVVRLISLSKRQYYREHKRALRAAASLLWDRWRPPGVDTRAEGRPARESPELAREAKALCAAGEAGSHRAVLLDEALASIAEMLRPLYARRGVTLSLVVPDALPPIRGDRVALRQALTTVLGHAVQHTTSRSLDVTVRPVRDGVSLEIGGTASEAPSAEELGLEESRPFVEALRGRLDAALPTGPGPWLVTIWLPAERRPAVLVVDNSPDFHRLIDRYLADEAWEAIGVSDVETAYALALERCPRAILLDVVMPDHDGWELLQTLKQNPATRDIPVVVCSVLNDPDVALALGASAYLHKPVSQADVTRALDSVAPASGRG